MSNNRMWLEHVDTGERVLIAKFSSVWFTPDLPLPLSERLDAAFDSADKAGRTYADGREDGGPPSLVGSALCSAWQKVNE